MVLVKKRNPTLTTSQWKKRAMGLYGTRLVFSEVGQQDQVKEDDEVTEDIQLMRAASVELNTVLGVACVIVQTSTKTPLVFRPQDERQHYLLQEWAKAIKTAVMPPTPGTVDPLVELQALMRRKDLTAAEAQRAQMLMRQGGAGAARRPARSSHQQPQPMSNNAFVSDQRTIPTRQAEQQMLPGASSSAQRQQPPTTSSSWGAPLGGDGRALFGGGGAAPTQPAAMLATPPKGMLDDPFAGLSSGPSTSATAPPVSSGPAYGSGASGGGSLAGGSFAAPPNPFAAPVSSRPPQTVAANPPMVPQRTVQQAVDPFAAAPPPSRPPPRQPPAVAMLTAVYDGDGEYYGYIAPNGTCYDLDGVCVGYLNDRERTAGSPRGEYLGCVSEPRRGEAMIETPDGSPLARIDLGHAKVVTLAGSTVAQFKVDGNVVADLGHAVCCFEKLSLRDQPTMALYLSFIAPDLLKTAASKVHGGPPPVGLQRETHNGSSYHAPQQQQQQQPVRVLPHASPQPVNQETPMRALPTPGAPLAQARDVFAEMPSPRAVSQPPAPPPPPAREAANPFAAPPSADSIDSPPAAPPPPPPPPPRAPQGLPQPAGVVDKPPAGQPPPPPPRDSQPSQQPAVDASHSGPPPPPPPRASNAPVEQLTEGVRGASIQDSKDLVRYVAIADFEADSSDWQVSISQGDKCSLVEDLGDGWSSIILDAGGNQGAVPSAFIEPVGSATAAPEPDAAPPQKLYTVAHSFQAQDPTWQIDVEQDEMVSLSQEFDDGWSEIIKADGTRGLVPSGFLRG